MIARLRGARADLALLDFTHVSDEAVKAAFDSLP
jgi:hypothetical protein